MEGVWLFSGIAHYFQAQMMKCSCCLIGPLGPFASLSGSRLESKRELGYDRRLQFILYESVQTYSLVSLVSDCFETKSHSVQSIHVILAVISLTRT